METSRLSAGVKILLAVAGAAPFVSPHMPVMAPAQTHGLYEAYSSSRLQELLKGNEPVFVNMTAAWCITCKVNEKIALSRDETKKLFTDLNVHYLKGDWTNRNAEITEYLARYGRNGVPLYVYYGARDEKTGKRPDDVVLPQILTPAIIENTVNRKESSK